MMRGVKRGDRCDRVLNVVGHPRGLFNDHEFFLTS
jgi:hypothetical protein